MFKRSMLSVALVATVVCQSLQAADAPVVSSDAVVSYMDSAKQSIQTNWASIANSVSTNTSSLAGFVQNVFSPSNHKTVFAAINEAYKNDGCKAAYQAFFNNKPAVVATGLTLTAVAATCFAAYKYFSKPNEKIDISSFVEIPSN